MLDFDRLLNLQNYTRGTPPAEQAEA